MELQTDVYALTKTRHDLERRTFSFMRSLSLQCHAATQAAGKESLSKNVVSHASFYITC